MQTVAQTAAQSGAGTPVRIEWRLHRWRPKEERRECHERWLTPLG